MDEIEIWGMDGKMNKARPVQPDRPAYQEPGKATGGIRNLVLLNNGYAKDDSGIWTKKELTPYISYVNEREEPEDWLFDGILYHGLRSPEGRDFTTGTANLDDWRWYLDKTFAEQGDLQQLNEAVAEAGRRLGDPGHKVKVVLMIPNPGDSAGDFGDVDGDGIPESFNTAGIGTEAAYANKLKAVTWWITQVKERWKEEKYPNLKLNGMYWSSKGISLTDPSEPNLIQATGSLMHRNHLNYFWIPHFQGNRNFDWMDLGFDAALLEPNHYGSPAQIPQRLGDAAELARQYHMGVELEWDERINKDNEKRQQYIDDLNGGADYGYMYDAFKTYDQGESKALLDSARSTDPVSRQNYDFLYQFVMGTYEKPEPCAKKPDGPIERTARQYVVKCGSEITIAHKYNDFVDLWFVFDRFGANKLVSFKEWRLAENTGTDANPDMERPYTLLQGDVSDWIGPYIVRANADGNGHPPSFTGGNHAYDGGNTGSATAVTESVQVWADGVELEEGKVVSSDEVKIRVVNLVQGYNTKLQDGTGRAVLKETVTYEISGGRVRVHNDIEALEDIIFETYYGLQTVNGAWNHTVRYYAGDREAASSPANVYSDSGTKTLNPDIDSFLLSSDDQGGFRHMLRVQLDRQYGLGTLQHLAEDMPVVFTQNYGKTYFLQIKGTAPELKKGERFSWQGSYDFYSQNQ
ncbi:DUF4855 domain-containing protein [Paenibacillus sp. DMB20]|uniref:DUF4855 domain-containing protein n=1 Tax=Paenibacillus sp. DMB20 TaxID=1642570 RepID=UPI000A627A27|nr:DUF4855 domain-containing protein [Paenibacillus sp. DMB20]